MGMLNAGKIKSHTEENPSKICKITFAKVCHFIQNYNLIAILSHLESISLHDILCALDNKKGSLSCTIGFKCSL